MEDNKFHLTPEELSGAWSSGPESYIRCLTDAYLLHVDGEINEYNIDALNANQHTLLAYRYMLDEVMNGGFIQLIQNGYGPYVLEGPFAMMMKKRWGMADFGKFMYDVRREYKKNREALEAELSEDDFMALYEQQEKMNEYGDEFLDTYQEAVTPGIATYVRENEDCFLE